MDFPRQISQIWLFVLWQTVVKVFYFLWYLENFDIYIRRAGIIAECYVQVMLLFRFLIKAEKHSVTRKRPFFLRLKKQAQASTFVTIFLRQGKKWLTVFCEFKANNMK